MSWEFEFLYWLQGLHTGWLDWLMTRITMLGDHGFFWVGLGVILFCLKRTRKIGFAMLISIALGGLVGNIVLKNLIARQRPCWIDPDVGLLVKIPWDYSFPSGHTMVSFEGAVSILLIKKRWGILALVLAVLIMISRLYLFVHFPTDVLAGMVIGISIAIGVNRLILPRLRL